MKRIYLVIATAMLSGSVHAQTPQVLTFESLLANSESYNNNSGGNYFDFQVVLENHFDSQWSSWSAFSLSNVTDNSSAGFGNQYASYTGGGRNSATYAVHYYQGGILNSNIVDASLFIDSFYITNTAYAAIAMRDGDAISKKFGEPLNADGQVDGTNGEDYFKVWIIGADYGQTQKDSIEFYLADFRFSDNNQDYIVDQWVKIDLSSFAFDVSSVDFRYESSDVGQWGINTPTYFAVDDIYYRIEGAGIAENEIGLGVYPNPVNEELTIEGQEGTVTIYDINGQRVYAEKHIALTKVDFSTLAKGVYVVTLENQNGKSTQRVVK